jgi:hypothetical protein
MLSVGKQKIATPNSTADNVSNPRETFEKAKEKTGNLTPNVKAYPQNHQEEVPQKVESLQQSK